MNMSTKTAIGAAGGCCLSLSLAIALGIGVLPLCPKANAEEVGTSQADLPNLVARFYIDNPSGKPIKYSVKWGKDGGYTEYTRAGRGPWYHQHALTGPNRAPQPYVHFGGTTYKVAWGEYGSGGSFGESASTRQFTTSLSNVRMGCGIWSRSSESLPDVCAFGYVWREAGPTDHVCVTPESRSLVKQENSRASQRWSLWAIHR